MIAALLYITVSVLTVAVQMLVATGFAVLLRRMSS